MSSPVIFPAEELPSDGPLQRLLGLYPQVQEGLWLQRVKVLGGNLTAEQWADLGSIVQEFTPNTPLHLTTRQDVEIHNIKLADIVPIQQRLAEAGMTGLGSCGDTVRNVTVCVCAAVAAIDLMPLAWAIRRLLEQMQGTYALPRKFKISLSACANACAQPWINDLGLIAMQQNGRQGFRVIGAGSLGPKPVLGVTLFPFLDANDVLPMVAAAVELFAEHGDRQNRRTARLRHARLRLGDEVFLRLLTERFVAAKARQSWPAAMIGPALCPEAAKADLAFVNGDVTPQQAAAISELAARADLQFRIMNNHRIRMYAAEPQALAAVVERPELAAAAAPQPIIVACPGQRWCKHGLVDTNALAHRIKAELTGKIPAGASVCISGCPNGCAHTGVADVGLSGGVNTIDGQRHDAFDLYFGGDMGHGEKLAQLDQRKLSVDEVLAAIAAHFG